MKKSKLPIAKIRTKFKDEWVLLDQYELDERNEPLRGVVIAHSKDREVIYDKQMTIEKPFCILYTSEPPKNLAFMF